MRKFLTLLAATVLLLGLGAIPSQADWGPADGHKMHFPQLPDENGYDVKATFPLVLADDFRCSETGWIKDIHFWGSWLHGVPGQIMSFTLSIHADIPANPPQVPYSMPGALLWERVVTQSQYVAQPILGGAIEDWYDPETGQVIFNDHTEYWQYNIFLDSLDWFMQEEGTIYWLNVSAHVMDPAATQWGWKTSLNHFNDDAVWTMAGSGIWNELVEPDFPPVTDIFWGGLDMTGMILPGSGGINAYGAGWYYYPEENWWNIWFYDHPFRTDRFKNVVLEFDVFKFDPGLPSFVEIAVNYSTAWWSTTGNPEPAPRVPPLPGCIEDSAIGRVTLLIGPDLQGHFVLPWEFFEYNPEWVSIDIRGTNFMIPEGMGMITHACMPKGDPVSLDLAFVINGEPAVVGWDCHGNPPPGKTGGGSESEPNDACQIANPAQCEYAYCGVINPMVIQDQDWWRIDLPATTDVCYCVHARVFGNDTPGQYAAGGGLDPDLTVYSADCSTVLFYNNDHMGAFPDAVGRDAQYDCADPGNCYPGGTTLYLRVASNPALPTGGPYLLVVNCYECECPQPPRDTVKCEPQGGLNPTHPPTYWYDVTPTVTGRCDFHVEVFDSILTHYSNFVDPPTWTHALHKAGGKWWISWWSPGCLSPITSTFRFQFDNASPSVWSDWRTTTSATKDPYNQVVDSSANHTGSLDGYGYRIHAPKDIIEPPVTKWEQPPNLSPLGMDVMSTSPFILADDFQCTSTGPITEIHVFASWFQDVFPGLDPGLVSFTLSLHADIPQGPDGWSIPGPMLWFREFVPGQFVYHPHAIGLVEGWYNPLQSEYNPMGDTQCWEYVFYLDEGEFVQQGTPDAPLVYWLDVQARPSIDGPLFGWKTTSLGFNWNDDAVWTQGIEPTFGPWVEMVYPPTHPWAGESINLAFSIAGKVQYVTGACCRGHLCTTETALHCNLTSGYYVGDGQPCTPDPCCCTIMGNLDGSSDGLVTMGDLTVLIDHLFISLTPLTCWPEGNLDLSPDYIVGMADLTVLIDHLFITLTPLPSCPW